MGLPSGSAYEEIFNSSWPAFAVEFEPEMSNGEVLLVDSAAFSSARQNHRAHPRQPQDLPAVLRVVTAPFHLTDAVAPPCDVQRNMSC